MTAPGQVPDTLDLADHGRLAINGMLGSLDPAVDYECAFLNILDVHPAYMLHWSTMVSGVMPKYVEALPLLRQMSGSGQDRDVEKGFIEAMLNNPAEDGLIYDRATDTRPWNVGVYYGKADWNEDYANMAGNGRFITGLLYWHQMTGEDVWLERARRTAERMLGLAIVEGDRGWYPNPGVGNDFSYPRTSGWTTTAAPEKATEGFEGGAMFYLFQPLRGWWRYYATTGDARFLGHTAVDVKEIADGTQVERATGHGEGPRTWYRLFRRERMRARNAPTKATPAYVHPDTLVRWTVL